MLTSFGACFPLRWFVNNGQLSQGGASMGTRGKIQISKMTVSSLPFSSKILLYLLLICELILKDKSDISNSLKNLHEGNLTFPRAELIPFLRSVDREVDEYATDSNLKKYLSKFLKMCQNVVLNYENLEADLCILSVCYRCRIVNVFFMV